MTKRMPCESCVRDRVVHLGINVRSSTHICRCVGDGSNAMAVF